MGGLMKAEIRLLSMRMALPKIEHAELPVRSKGTW